MSTSHLKIPDLPLKKADLKPARKPRVSLEGKVGSRVDRDNYRGNGHWLFDETMGKSEYVGFIYAIRNKETNRSYIGKKLYVGTGKINRGLESNWPWYISSSKELAADIKAFGKSAFEFICIEEYKTKGGLSWAETWSISQVEAPTNQEKWYNVAINGVDWKVKEEITERHKQRLKIIVDLLK